MANPAEHLPPTLSEASIRQLLASINLPEPEKIRPLQVAAAYHSVYFLHFGSEQIKGVTTQREPDGSLILVLRVSGRHLPRVKTLNEVGVMTWVRHHTSIPVPAVVRFDASESNAIGHEFMLLEKAPGISVDKVYDGLGEDGKRYLIEQLTDYLVQLHSKPWKPACVCGLVPDGDAIVPGPAIDETFWQVPDIPKYWEENETLESLNPLDGPYPSWTSYADACLERYMHAIEVHPSLGPYRDLLPRIQALRTAITTTYAAELDHTEYIIAHKDMHFANIMCEPATARITAVLDWEFSGVVPAPRWNPVRAFLWNGQQIAEANTEKYRLMALFEEVCKAKSAEWLLDQVKPSPRQEAMSTAVNHIRAIVEVCPRGRGDDRLVAWRVNAENAMERLGV